jgi:hypothetical protein
MGLTWAPIVKRKEIVIKPAGKQPHGRPTRKWKNNIKMNLREMVCKVKELIELPRGGGLL